jgi:hypothetical protein
MKRLKRFDVMNRLAFYMVQMSEKMPHIVPKRWHGIQLP